MLSFSDTEFIRPPSAPPRLVGETILEVVAPFPVDKGDYIVLSLRRRCHGCGVLFDWSSLWNVHDRQTWQLKRVLCEGCISLWRLADQKKKEKDQAKKKKKKRKLEKQKKENKKKKNKKKKHYRKKI